jgi:hypothetical protein
MMNVSDLDEVFACIDENPEKTVDFWISVIRINKWESAHAIEKYNENFTELVNEWTDADGNTVWHEIAKINDNWSCRNFLSKYGISLKRNKLGKTPVNYWSTLGWANVWMNLLDRGEWKRIWDKTPFDIHPVVDWAKSKKIDLAVWGWANRPPMAAEDILTLQKILEKLPKETHDSWKAWGYFGNEILSFNA